MQSPKLLKGFRDFLPETEIARKALTEKLESIFRFSGFVPIDTPALEYSEVLFGKGGGETDKQGYRFTDGGGRDVALRFDLTVPFARFSALHLDALALPFKRYHIAKVWRGENTQRGRFREFTQCDFDIIGTESAAADFEILFVMHKALCAISDGASIRVNHRGLFTHFLQKLQVERHTTEILRTVDKLGKIGKGGVEDALSQIIDGKSAKAVLDFVGQSGVWEDVEAALKDMAGASPALERLSELRGFMRDAGVEGSFTLDLSIARGLDYYTGVVFESFLTRCPEIGSVCSGGRYDNLAGLYTEKRLPGVGASVGLDRLMAANEANDSEQNAAKTYSRVAIVCLRNEDAGKYQSAAQVLRERGVPCEVFFEAQKNAAQFQLAEKKGIPYTLLLQDDGKWTLRNLATRENQEGLTLEMAGDYLSAT